MSNHGAITLSDLATDGVATVGVACRLCPRRGRYAIAGLLERFGNDGKLPDVAFQLSAGCPKRHNRLYDRCSVTIGAA